MSFTPVSILSTTHGVLLVIMLLFLIPISALAH